MATFKCDYQEMLKVSSIFSQHSEDTKTIYQMLYAPYEALRNGAWVGVGANKFFDEMENLLLPAVQKLEAHLGQIGEDSARIGNAAQNTEQTILARTRRA